LRKRFAFVAGKDVGTRSSFEARKGSHLQR